MNNLAKYMELALELAFDGMGLCSPNPSVGAVIVKDGRLIAACGTSPACGPHAEASALQRAGIEARGADMYVSLEPCCHYGKNPPCTEAIIRSGIRRVFIAVSDPNPLVNGSGAAALRNAGIEVIFPAEALESGEQFIKPFTKFITEGKPYLIYKNAVTLDGRTASSRGDSKWISSEYSRFLVHRLRAKVDAVIIGLNTYIKDAPSLDVRLSSFGEEVRSFFRDRAYSWSGSENFFLRKLLERGSGAFKNPLRVIIGLPGEHLRLQENCLFFGSEPQGGASGPRDNYVSLDGVSPEEQSSFILKELASRGIMCAMLEGGSTTAGMFFNSGEIDQYMYFIAPLLAGSGLPSIQGREIDSIAECRALEIITLVNLGGDILYNSYKKG